jgi:hypothetical protein
VANANFIVAARNNLRPLLDLVAQMGAALDGELKERRFIHRADGLEECAYCGRLMSLDRHADACPVGALAAWEQAKGGSE